MADENQCLKDEEVDCSSHHMRAIVWDLKVPYIPNGVHGGSQWSGFYSTYKIQ